MTTYKLNKEQVFQTIAEFFPDDFKITSLAENARAFYLLARKKGIKESCFPMLGSMGQELSMGLGVALGSAKTGKKCVVISSDGSLLSNINTFILYAILKPENLVVILLDNEVHGITGGQPTGSKYVKLTEIGKTCHMDSYLISKEDEMEKTFKEIKKKKNMAFVQVKINTKVPPSEHIKEPLPSLFYTFSEYIQKCIVK